MRYEIVLSPEAAEDLRGLRAYDRAIVREALETHLRHEPMKVSRSRIKRLRGTRRPQYRLRIGDFRAFYDVAASDVQVLAIVSKADADGWLQRTAIPDESPPDERASDEESGPLQDQG